MLVHLGLLELWKNLGRVAAAAAGSSRDGRGPAWIQVEFKIPKINTQFFA